MIQWEYRIFDGDTWFGRLSLTQLNVLGSQGWELVSKPRALNKDWLFKRIKPAPTTNGQ